MAAIQAQMHSENMGLPPVTASRDWMPENNGCGYHEFGLNLQQQAQQQKLKEYQHRQQQQQFLPQLMLQKNHQFLAFENSLLFHSSCRNYPTTTTTTTTTSSSTIMNHNPAAAATGYGCNNNQIYSSSLSQSLAAQIEKQKQEFDAYITLENDRLKMALHEQRKQQLANLLKKLDAKATILLRQKDEEIAQANKRTIELDEFVRRLEVENQLWQRVAEENAAMISSLNTTIEQLREKASNLDPAEDAESCCCVVEENRGGGRRRDMDAEDEEEERSSGGMTAVCTLCNSNKSCVLFLPCRHLCSCKDCEALLHACPLCKSVKQASIQALFS
ncbi:hypothetical protein Dimus_002837 [Dionaea muscipula]